MASGRRSPEGRPPRLPQRRQSPDPPFSLINGSRGSPKASLVDTTIPKNVLYDKLGLK
jgi:hypothetical protein